MRAPEDITITEARVRVQHMRENAELLPDHTSDQWCPRCNVSLLVDTMASYITWEQWRELELAMVLAESFFGWNSIDPRNQETASAYVDQCRSERANTPPLVTTTDEQSSAGSVAPRGVWARLLSYRGLRHA